MHSCPRSPRRSTLDWCHVRGWALALYPHKVSTRAHRTSFRLSLQKLKLVCFIAKGCLFLYPRDSLEVSLTNHDAIVIFWIWTQPTITTAPSAPQSSFSPSQMLITPLCVSHLSSSSVCESSERSFCLLSFSVHHGALYT